MAKVTLYGKTDCPLCDNAKTVLESARRRVHFEFEEVDVSLDPELLSAYGERVPLVWIDDRLAFKYHVDPDVLEKRIAGDDVETK